MISLLTLLACGVPNEGGGTAVGNPSMTAVRIAPSDTGSWDAATASVELALTPCDGGEAWRTHLEVLDLLEGAPVQTPGGRWCSLEVQVRDLTATGEASLQVTQAEVVFSISGVLDGADLVLELGDPSSPSGLESRSGLYAERVVDRRIDAIERSEGALVAGPERSPDPEEPSVMMVVGEGGFRSPQLAEPAVYDVDDGGEAFLSVAHHDGRWVAVGSYSGIRSAASTDHGQTWSEGDLDAFSSSVHVRDGEFIAISGNGAINVSPDGVAWTRIHSAEVSLVAGVSSPSRTVVVGQEVVLYADDARTWVQVDLPGSGRFLDVAWSPAGFVAVGFDGVVHHSLDGASWTDVTPGTTHLAAVVWSGTRFVAVGDSESWVSADGISWTPGASKMLNDVAVHEGRLYGVSGAYIFESIDQGASWQEWRFLDVPWMVGIGSNGL